MLEASKLIQKLREEAYYADKSGAIKLAALLREAALFIQENIKNDSSS